MIDASFIVFLNFILFAFVFYRYAGKKAKDFLDQQVSHIQKEIERIAELKERTRQQCQHEKRLLAEAHQQAEQLRKNAQEHNFTLKQQLLHEIDIIINTKRTTSQTMMSRLRQQTIDELRNIIISNTLSILRLYVQKNVLIAEQYTQQRISDLKVYFNEENKLSKYF